MFKLNEEQMFYDIAEGQAVVIDFTTGIYYGTSSLGSVVLDRLIAGCAPEKIAAAVKALPGCPEDMDVKLNEFAAKLQEIGILITGETQDGGDEPIEEKALAEGFELSVEAFSEVQDLILADPVHDVDVEQGWPVLKEE